MANFQSQTLSQTFKTKIITKNGFGMPKIKNPAFVPVNQSEAKERIAKTIEHHHEIKQFLDYNLQNDKGLSQTSDRF